MPSKHPDPNHPGSVLDLVKEYVPLHRSPHHLSIPPTRLPPSSQCTQGHPKYKKDRGGNLGKVVMTGKDIYFFAYNLLRRIYPDVDNTSINDALTRTKLASSSPSSQLSNMQQWRLTLACALVYKATVIVLIDPPQKISKLIARLR